MDGRGLCYDNRGMRFVLIEGGDIYTPRRAGVQPLLLADSKIVKLGPVETSALHALSDEVTTIDATGCIVVPGLINRTRTSSVRVANTGLAAGCLRSWWARSSLRA